MTGTVENSISVLIKELKDNRKVDKDAALDYAGYVFRLITQNNVPLDQRWGAAMTVDDCTKKIRGDNFQRAEGFFGNWAKQLEEKKGEVVDDIDDHYSGC
jgi:hypothetical protein